MIIAVTGSSGFTGKLLTKRLNELNHEVIKLDIKEGIDVTNFESLSKVPKFDLIYHLAAMSYVPDSYLKPHDFYKVNVNATLNTLELSRKYDAKYVYISSYIYGNPVYLPIDEKHRVISFNPYADTKIIGENLCRSYNKFFGMNIIIIRPFNIYGPDQTNNFLIPFILKQAIKGKIELNDPNPKRDLIYIDDLIELYVKLIDYKSSSFEIFNAGYGKSYSVKDIVRFIVELFPSEIEVNFLNKIRPNEVNDTIADIKKADELLNWKPKIDLDEGLSKIINRIEKEEHY